MFSRLRKDAEQELLKFIDDGSNHSHRYYLRIAGTCATINALSWVAAFVTPEVIAEWTGLALDLSDKAKAFLLGVPFWSTFLATYALLCLPRYKNPTISIEDSDVFVRYRDAERSSYLRNRILVSATIAALNVIFLVAAVLWLR